MAFSGGALASTRPPFPIPAHLPPQLPACAGVVAHSRSPTHFTARLHALWAANAWHGCALFYLLVIIVVTRRLAQRHTGLLKPLGIHC